MSMYTEWDSECKHCGIGTDRDYCHDCEVRGYDPSCANYKGDPG